MKEVPNQISSFKTWAAPLSIPENLAAPSCNFSPPGQTTIGHKHKVLQHKTVNQMDAPWKLDCKNIRSLADWKQNLKDCLTPEYHGCGHEGKGLHFKLNPQGGKMNSNQHCRGLKRDDKRHWCWKILHMRPYTQGGNGRYCLYGEQ